jgi:S-adenosylmethionine:tRNA ribosyltransferase-isomerase
MNTNLLDYALPSGLIAQDPVAVRSESRLLVLSRSNGVLTDSRFSRLGEFLRPGDGLVLNDTKVLPARFFARRATGGKLEGLFLREVPPLGTTGRPSPSPEIAALGCASLAMTSTAPEPSSVRDAIAGSEASPAMTRTGLSHVMARSAASLPPRRACPRPDRGRGKQSRATAGDHANGRSRIWEVLLKGARKVKPGESIHIEDREQRDFRTARVLEKRPDGVCLLEVQAQADAETVLSEVGFPPLPPYIRRDHDLARAHSDLGRYQTVYARCPGAVAAPTAGLHFTEELMSQLKAAGVVFACVTLHVGAGTFKPIATDEVEQHEIHREWYRLDAANADTINTVRRNGGRIVAVGTTVTRVLETVADVNRVGWASAHADGLIEHTRGQHGLKPILPACEGTTNLFITPGYEYKIVDAMITNFHLPRSTLLALVAAFTGLERMRAAYHHAIEERYRFYSYGDAMLIL